MMMKPHLRQALGWITLLAFAVALRAAPPEPVKGGVTFVVVPDSQKYVWNRPELYTLQTGWIAANIGKYNLVRLLHVGDVTQHNNREEWEAARRAMESAAHDQDGLHSLQERQPSVRRSKQESPAQKCSGRLSHASAASCTTSESVGWA